ncbi:MAG: HAD family phosphatase [Solobacterium sp.]|nr:HAD family phosphatase [Solobacterium sp.]
MKNIKMVVFDVDGTLLNTEFLWGEVWDIVGKKYNCPAFCTAHDLVVGITGNDLRRVLDEKLSMVTVEQREKMLNEARHIGRNYLKEHLRKMPFVDDIIEDLERQGYPLCVATTTDREMTLQRLSQTNLLHHFSHLICGDEVSRRKPDAQIYLKICAQADVSPNETLVIEDTGFGVEAAYRAGCDCIMVPSVREPSERERKLAFAVVKDLGEARELIQQAFRKAA